MKKEYKQMLFNHFWFEMEHLKEPCMSCGDMDCKRSYIQKYLKKKCDILDCKNCMKECKQRSELYQKVLLVAGSVKNTDEWFNTPIQALDYNTPKELITKGKTDIVERLVDSWESGIAL